MVKTILIQIKPHAGSRADVERWHLLTWRMANKAAQLMQSLHAIEYIIAPSINAEFKRADEINEEVSLLFDKLATLSDKKAPEIRQRKIIEKEIAKLKAEIKEINKEARKAATEFLYGENGVFNSSRGAVLYRAIRDDKQFEGLPSIIRSYVVELVKKDYGTAFTKITKGEGLLPQYSRNIPLPFPKAAIRIEDKVLKFGGKTASFDLIYPEGSLVDKILKGIQAGEFALCDSKIQLKNKFYLLLSYKTTDKAKKDTNTALSFVFGEDVPAYAYCNGELLPIGYKNQVAPRFRLMSEIRRLRKEQAPNDLIGQKLDKLDNHCKTLIHQISSKIVQMAEKHNAGIVHYEDLSLINKKAANLGEFPYFDIINKLKYKLEEKGIALKIVESSFNRERCECGQFGMKHDDYFTCECGKTVNFWENYCRNVAENKV